MSIKAALLDEQGIFLCIDDVADEASLTDRHLSQVTSCDLPPNQYVWVPDEKNQDYGGAFWSVAWLKRVNDTIDKAAEEKKVARAPRSRIALPEKFK